MKRSTLLELKPLGLFDRVRIKPWNDICAQYPDRIMKSASGHEDFAKFGSCEITETICDEYQNVDLFVGEISLDYHNQAPYISYDLLFIDQTGEIDEAESDSYYSIEMLNVIESVRFEPQKFKKLKKSKKIRNQFDRTGGFKKGKENV